MTAVARFRLFGRHAAGPPPYPSPPPAPTEPPTAPGWSHPPTPPRGAPPHGAPPWPQPPAARSTDPTADPPTDPFGFPPVPAGAGSAPGPRSAVPDPAEAAALAGAFAVDYLSWDEDDPERRARVLRDYLKVPGSDPAHLGWSGHGRQRAEFALPGLVRGDGDGRVLVDVRVRVTPYRAVGEHGPEPAGPEPDVAGVPAVAPAPTGRGWRSLASYWIRINVPVTVDGGRLVVDAWEETLGEDPPPPSPSPPAEDHSLDDDDPLTPLQAPPTGGAW